MRSSRAFNASIELIEKQKVIIAAKQQRIESLRGEFDGMCRLATAKNVEIGALNGTILELNERLARAADLRSELQERVAKSERGRESAEYKLQLNRDEVVRMANAVNLNAAEISRLKAELETRTQAHVKICKQNTKLREELRAENARSRGTLRRLQEEYGKLYARYQDDVPTAIGLLDLHERVSTLEALQWQEGEGG